MKEREVGQREGSKGAREGGMCTHVHVHVLCMCIYNLHVCTPLCTVVINVHLYLPTERVMDILQYIPVSVYSLLCYMYICTCTMYMYDNVHALICIYTCVS